MTDKQNIDTPHERRPFKDHGHMDVVTVADFTLGRGRARCRELYVGEALSVDRVGDPSFEAPHRLERLLPSARLRWEYGRPSGWRRIWEQPCAARVWPTTASIRPGAIPTDATRPSNSTPYEAGCGPPDRGSAIRSPTPSRIALGRLWIGQLRGFPRVAPSSFCTRADNFAIVIAAWSSILRVS